MQCPATSARFYALQLQAVNAAALTRMQAAYGMYMLNISHQVETLALSHTTCDSYIHGIDKLRY